MNQIEQDQFELELRGLTPARPPKDFIERLAAARPTGRARESQLALVGTGPRAWQRILLRWLFPATAVAALAVMTWRETSLPGRVAATGKIAPAAAPLRADNVQIDRKLVSDFDAVARLPGGQPVRFRCQQWMDRVVLSDRDRGIVVQRETPRVEVVPVKFETY